MMNWMKETYRANSAAHTYYFGFVLAGLLYVVAGMNFDELSAYFKMDRASSAKGGFAKIRIRANANDLKALLPMATLLGSAELLNDGHWNKGEMFEKIITERYTTEQWVKDSVPFFKAGDAEINGEQVQIKLNGAELTNEKILHRYFG
jgi:hypothetical protein